MNTGTRSLRGGAIHVIATNLDTTTAMPYIAWVHSVIETRVETHMTALGKRLINAAKEARAIARGVADPKTYRVHVPDDIDVKRIRRRLKLTQNEFARRFGIPQGTLRDWEQGRRQPEGPARAFLLVIQHEPVAVERALARATTKAA